MTAKPKTPTEQRARVADARPTLTLVDGINADEPVPSELVPDTDNGEQPKATDTTCAAVAIHNGVHVACELAVRHVGDHDYNGLTWRRRSGDPE